MLIRTVGDPPARALSPMSPLPGVPARPARDEAEAPAGARTYLHGQRRATAANRFCDTENRVADVM